MGYFHTFELSRSPSAHSWALTHVRAFSFAFGSLVGTSTRLSFLVRLRLTRGHFHTFEHSCSASAHSWALPHVRAFSFALGSLVGTSTRSSFLVRLRLTSQALPHVRA